MSPLSFDFETVYIQVQGEKNTNVINMESYIGIQQIQQNVTLHLIQNNCKLYVNSTWNNTGHYICS